MVIGGWRSDVCSSDRLRGFGDVVVAACVVAVPPAAFEALGAGDDARARVTQRDGSGQQPCRARRTRRRGLRAQRSEEHTSELQSLMRISYAVFCLKKKTNSTRQMQEEYTPKHTLREARRKE